MRKMILKVTLVVVVQVLCCAAEEVRSNCDYLTYDYGYTSLVGFVRVPQQSSASVDVEMQLAYWTWPNSNPSGSLTYTRGAGGGGSVEFRLELGDKEYPPPVVTRLTVNGRVLCSSPHQLHSVSHRNGQVIGEMTLSSYVKSQSSHWSSDSGGDMDMNMRPSFDFDRETFHSHMRPQTSPPIPVPQEFLDQLQSHGFSQTDIDQIIKDYTKEAESHSMFDSTGFTNHFHTGRETTPAPVHVPRPQRPQRPQWTQQQPQPQPQQVPPRFRPTPPPPPPPTTTPRPVYRPPPTTPQPVYRPPPTTRPPPPPPTAPPTAPPPQCGTIGFSVSPLIIGGDTYTRGDWPWLVAIYTTFDGKLTYICCGTLISDRHIITAAHCMLLGEIVNLQPKDIVVRVGAFNLDTWGDDVQRSLSDARVHDDYNSTTLANDISIMTFVRPVEFNNYIKPICLWDFDTSLDQIANKVGVVTGWGKDENGLVGRGPPKVTRVPIVGNATCRASHSDFHKFTNNGNTFCAGKQDGSGPCNGDSGGGLYLMRNRRWYIRGLVSLALLPENGLKDHCNLDEYLVFTDVAKFRPWITSFTSR